MFIQSEIVIFKRGKRAFSDAFEKSRGALSWDTNIVVSQFDCQFERLVRFEVTSEKKADREGMYLIDIDSKSSSFS